MTNESQKSESQASAAPPEALPQELAAEARALREVSQSVGTLEGAARGGEASAREALKSSDFPSHVHSYVREFIGLADQKAGFVFTISAALLAYQFSESFHLLWLRPIKSWTLVAGLSFLSVLALFFAAVAAAAVVLPRMARSHEGVVFFRSITGHASAAAYASSVLALQDSDISRALLQHTFDLAKVCSRKYTVLAWALWLVAIGVLAGLVVLLLKSAG